MKAGELNFETFFRALSTSIFPNGGAKCWFTMVQSIKNHQLNKSKTPRLDFKQPPFEKTKSNRQPGQAFCNIKTWFRIALYGDMCPKWKRYEAGPNLNTNHPCFFLGTIFSQLANPNLIVLCTDGVFRLTFHDMILLSVGLILKDQKQGHWLFFSRAGWEGLFPTESSTSFQAPFWSFDFYSEALRKFGYPFSSGSTLGWLGRWHSCAGEYD